jgi:hypothetical protein
MTAAGLRRPGWSRGDQPTFQIRGEGAGATAGTGRGGGGPAAMRPSSGSGGGGGGDDRYRGSLGGGDDLSVVQLAARLTDHMVGPGRGRTVTLMSFT